MKVGCEPLLEHRKRLLLGNLRRAVRELIDHEQCKAVSPCSDLPQLLGERGRINRPGS